MQHIKYKTHVHNPIPHTISNYSHIWDNTTFNICLSRLELYPEAFCIFLIILTNNNLKITYINPHINYSTKPILLIIISQCYFRGFAFGVRGWRVVIKLSSLARHPWDNPAWKLSEEDFVIWKWWRITPTQEGNWPTTWNCSVKSAI